MARAVQVESQFENQSENHAMEEQTRLIKKYPNRRLYDTEVSAYITLEDIKQLVLTRIPFRVVESRTGDEITRTILIQVISEQEDQGASVFTNELLENIIRFYGDSLQAVLGQFLETSMRQFIDQQGMLRRQMERHISGEMVDPFRFITEMAEHNFNLWMNWHKSWFFPTASKGSGSAPKESGSGDAG